MGDLILAIDQGTTSTRAMLFSDPTRVVAVAQEEFAQSYPRSGWVEHDPEVLIETMLRTVRDVLARARREAGEIAAIGITNQRETTLIWDRTTGRPIAPAIVWQDRRTHAACERLRAEGAEPMVSARTGLLLDPYFSATKIAWMLDSVDGARAAAERGELAFGTVDSWLIWRLTGGRVHATDATNASRTLLFDIRANAWDPELCALFGVPMAMLPEVRDSDGDFGTTDPAVIGAAIPIRGVAGDQQAATLGQACFRPGMMKATYGTGAFVLLVTGDEPVASSNRLLTTIAVRRGGRTRYALEGAIFVAGAAVQWLRDGLGVVGHAAESGPLAERADPAQDVYLVPAFTGLGAPHWDAEARGAIFGLTRGTGPAELARAALESVCFQTGDLYAAMHEDFAGGEATVLRADGGMAVSDWTMQRLADLLAHPVDRPAIAETTALGAAWLAGAAVGAWPDEDDFARMWARERRFEPAMAEEERLRRVEGWRDAVRRTLSG
ncbi:glycerol kinase GlpK [Amorphus orientalis]|uniref:Glycerol kinase n=1 Tax=Amorphus orientalis TaxID=649198 RepID=A0AAE3VRT7_9HYPH|nr:glycerol kinase GlpK [Amorphus orientalis]MDQ0316966.1 glycerol kinase [Amorphus orientalis]